MTDRSEPRIRRLGLLISPETHPRAGSNINGPCCIVAPAWLAQPPGRFYLYFADHAGTHIKFAHADCIEGPWRMADAGVLDLSAFRDAYDHVASPDILIDEENRRLRMYFHARSRSRGREQWTFAATSADGITFDASIDRPLAPFYLKVFAYRGWIYGMSKGGNLWRSKDGLTPFEPGGNPFDRQLSDEIWHNDPGSVRHVGLSRIGHLLLVYFTRIGDAPERILRVSIDISGDWSGWQVSDLREILAPAESYEGATLPARASVSGAATGPENALRDPHVLQHMGENYLFYSVCGEMGIAACQLSDALS